MRFRKKPACIYYHPERMNIIRTGVEIAGVWVRGGCAGGAKRPHRRKGTYRSATTVSRTICRCTINGSLKRGDLTRFDIYNKPLDDDARQEWNKQFQSLPRCPVLKSDDYDNLYEIDEKRLACSGCSRRLLFEEQNEENIVLSRLEDKDF